MMRLDLILLDTELHTQIQGKFIFFELVQQKHKTQVWAVINESASSLLGQILWYSGWRQYVFQPEPQTEFNVDCLIEISDIIKRLNQIQKGGPK